MDTVVLDTNAVYGDFWMRGPMSQDLLKLAEFSVFRIVIPRIVREELATNYEAYMTQEVAKARNSMKKLTANRVPPEGCSIPTDQTLSQLAADYRDWIRLLGRGVENLCDHDYSTLNLQALVDDAMEYKRPGTDSGVHFKDLLVWQAVLSSLSTESIVHFVSGDAGFRQAKQSADLHAQLVRQVTRRGGAVRLFTGLAEFLKGYASELPVASKAALLASDAFQSALSNVRTCMEFYSRSRVVEPFGRGDCWPLLTVSVESVTLSDARQIERAPETTYYLWFNVKSVTDGRILDDVGNEHRPIAVIDAAHEVVALAILVQRNNELSFDRSYVPYKVIR